MFFWVAVWVVVSLAHGCGCEERSMAEAVRVGAAMASALMRERWVDRGRENGDGGGELVRVMLRVLGVDSRKVPDMAFEGLISLVHLMCRVLIPEGGTEGKANTGGRMSLFRFIVERAEVADLLTRMQDPNLVEQVLRESKQKLREFPREQVECLQVVVCRTKPFVRGMQRSLRFFLKREGAGASTAAKEEDEETDAAAWEKAGLEERMYFFLPSLTEVVEEGRRCDQLFPNCVY